MSFCLSKIHTYTVYFYLFFISSKTKCTFDQSLQQNVLVICINWNQWFKKKISLWICMYKYTKQIFFLNEKRPYIYYNHVVYFTRIYFLRSLLKSPGKVVTINKKIHLG